MVEESKEPLAQEWLGRLRRSAARGSGGLTALALLTGAGAGLGAVAFRYMILGFTHLFTGHGEYGAAGRTVNPHLPGLGIWFVVAVPVVGGLISGWAPCSPPPRAPRSPRY